MNMRYLILILILLSSVSCSERYKVRRMMRDFTKSTVVIPEDLEYVYKREIRDIDFNELSSNKLIIYYDTLDCVSCKVSHIVENQALFDMADTCDFSVLLVFSPRFEDMDELRSHLMMSGHKFPVYIDVNHSFCAENPQIPADVRFHSFLINEDGFPYFVGNPMSDDALFKLFISVIDNTNTMSL